MGPGLDRASHAGGAEVAARDRLVALALICTGVIVATSAAGAVLPDSLGIVHAVVSFAAFVLGSCVFLWAYAVGVTRSRTEAVTMGGLFFVSGDVAPAPVRLRLWTALGVQIVAVVAAAAIRPYTNVAFGVLAPLLGLGLMALWGARYGSFAPRARAGDEDADRDGTVEG